MPSPRRAKRKLKHITAHSLVLEDAKGKPRIFMHAGDGDGDGDGDGEVSINLFGQDDRQINISTSAEGALYISLLGKQGTVSASLLMTPDEDVRLSIGDRQGRLGTMLGSTLFHAGKHGVVLFRNGQPFLSVPSPSKSKRKK